MVLGSIIMGMVGMVDVVLVAEVVDVQGANFTVGEDEAMAASLVDMTMVNQRHHLPKDVVSMQSSQF